MRGWRHESMRHSLAARGISTSWRNQWTRKLNPYREPYITGMSLAREAVNLVKEYINSRGGLEEDIRRMEREGFIRDAKGRTQLVYHTFSDELDDVMDKTDIDGMFKTYLDKRTHEMGPQDEAALYDEFANGFNSELRRLSYEYHDRLENRFGVR